MKHADPLIADLENHGYAELRKVFPVEQAEKWGREIESALLQGDVSAIRSQAGVLIAGRNLLSIYPDAKKLWRCETLIHFLRKVLGSECGLVRGLFFDKNPERSWSLPWHQDMAIAVKNNRLPSNELKKPTTKAGVPHVEGTFALLSNMLTFRIHLNDVSDDNGPLQVMPGSHVSIGQGEDTSLEVRTLHAQSGDVLAMRPLLYHRSGYSAPDSHRHRRVLHLEFASSERLPDGFEWDCFVRV